MLKDMQFLLFSVRQLVFGVWAKQVEEVLEDRAFAEPQDAGPGNTRWYKGREIRMINFGNWFTAERLYAVKGVAGSHKESDRACVAPKILIIKPHAERYAGVRIDHLEDLATISIAQVHSLPVLMQRTGRMPGLWGIALVQECPVILIDLAQV